MTLRLPTACLALPALQGIKVEAMGPRHHTERLSAVLEEPMLTAVLTEAGEASESGWFWNIRPLKSRVSAWAAGWAGGWALEWGW